MNPSKTLRDLAGWLIRLAKDFEDQHNAQNGQWGAALGNAELNPSERLDRLEERVAALEQKNEAPGASR
jgi:hypothetical protein